MTSIARLLAAGLFMGGLAMAAPAVAQTTIDTTGGTGRANVTPFGVPNSSTYGETFTAGSNNYLNSFTLYLTNGAASPISFEGYIYAWNGTMATGPALYASAAQTYSSGTDTPFSFNTGSLALTAGSSYVAFLSTAGLQAGQPDADASMPLVSDSTYAGGHFVYNNAGNNVAALTSTAWTSYPYDAFFKASFSGAPLASATPEPGTWAMMILGFGLAGCALRRRARTVTRVAFAA